MNALVSLNGRAPKRGRRSRPVDRLTEALNDRWWDSIPFSWNIRFRAVNGCDARVGACPGRLCRRGLVPCSTMPMPFEADVLDRRLASFRCHGEQNMTNVPTIARIWRGRTKPGICLMNTRLTIALREFRHCLRRRSAFNCYAKIERMKHGSRRSPTGPTCNR